jgi:excinuclease UvrABC nuclease subunit
MGKTTVEISDDDLNGLPKQKAVYAICASEEGTGKSIHCRYVGETDNLQERTKAHFSDSEKNEDLKKFMQGKKTKKMIYELLPGSDKQERLAKEDEWIKLYKPAYNIKSNP